MKAPQEKLRDGRQYSSPNKCGRKISRVSPRSELPYFCRVNAARNLAQLASALYDLVPRLLRRGQAPQAIVHDLALLATTAGFAEAVMPLVHEILMRGAA